MNTMDKVRVSKAFDFESAHALDGYDGKCKDIHGHSYHLIVTVIGSPIAAEDHIKQGMVIDFSDLKRIVKDTIVDRFDHALILKHDSRFKGIENKMQKVIYTDYQPTCENMVIDFAHSIAPLLPKNVQLHNLKLRETGNSYAEWYASDNL